MRRALRLAGLGRHASPNPMVGCVIVDASGHVVGEGWHHQPGGPHAEVWALRSAGTDGARGATAYVTLEPCSFTGRTPPCADALIAAGLRRVVIAMPDPDKRVSGSGAQRLREAGIDVTIGLLGHEAALLNAAYVKHRTSGLPWVVMKTAMTLDGRIATAAGDSRWISSDISRSAVHRQLRDRCDAVMCGVGTVLADDPRLTTRMRRDGRNPWRIIVDSRCRTPLDSKVVRQSSEDGRTIIATLDTAQSEQMTPYTDAGCQVITCDAGADGSVAISDLLARLGARGDIIGILAEPGARLSASLITSDLVDRWIVYIAPKVAGGSDAPGPVGGRGVSLMADAVRISGWLVHRSGSDIRIDAKFRVESS